MAGCCQCCSRPVSRAVDGPAIPLRGSTVGGRCHAHDCVSTAKHQTGPYALHVVMPIWFDFTAVGFRRGTGTQFGSSRDLCAYPSFRCAQRPRRWLCRVARGRRRGQRATLAKRRERAAPNITCISNDDESRFTHGRHLAMAEVVSPPSAPLGNRRTGPPDVSAGR